MAKTTIAKKDPADIQFDSFTLSKTGIEITGTPTFEEWEACGAFLQRANGALFKPAIPITKGRESRGIRNQVRQKGFGDRKPVH